MGERLVAVLDRQRAGVEARQVAAHARGIGLPVEAILLSQEHADLVAGLEVVAHAFPEAPIMAGEGTRDWTARNGRDLLGAMRGVFGAAIPETTPVPGLVLRPGETVRLAGVEWRVDQLGSGEAGGVTVLHSEANDALFAANTSAIGRPPGCSSGMSATGSRNSSRRCRATARSAPRCRATARQGVRSCRRCGTGPAGA